MPERLRAVLFDLDDTLLDWSGNRINGRIDWPYRDRELLCGVCDYLCAAGLGRFDPQALGDDFHERTMDAWERGRHSLRAPQLGQILLGTLGAAGLSTDALDERALLEACNWGPFPGVREFPDAPPLLRMLREQGLRLGIVTNAHQPMWMRDRELEAAGLLSLLPECRFSAADVGWLKPHPQIFETALDCLGIRPQEAVFVGDNPVADIAGAQGVGMRAVLRLREWPAPDLREGAGPGEGAIRPDHSLHSLQELPSVLDVWYPGWRA